VDEGKEVTLNYFQNVFGDSGCQAEYTAIFGGFILQSLCRTQEYMGASKPHHTCFQRSKSKRGFRNDRRSRGGKYRNGTPKKTTSMGGFDSGIFTISIPRNSPRPERS